MFVLNTRHHTHTRLSRIPGTIDCPCAYSKWEGLGKEMSAKWEWEGMGTIKVIPPAHLQMTVAQDVVFSAAVRFCKGRYTNTSW